MQIRPIFSTLRRHRLIAGLLALLVAFTCAIVCNVAFMITRHVGEMHMRSGVAENHLVVVRSFAMNHGANALVRHQTDLVALAKVPGVQSAVVVDGLPFGHSNWSISLATSPKGASTVDATVFSGTPGELQTLGLQLIAGRDFQADEYVAKGTAHGDAGLDHVTAAIVTRALAARLFPGQHALGHLVYPGKSAVRIVGVVKGLLRPGAGTGPDNNFSILLPLLPDTASATYMLNTDPQDRARVIKDATDALNHIDHDRVLRAKTFTQIRADHFEGNRTMIRLLVAAALALMFVAALGITGLASFWVQQRTRSIGIRRAIGATRQDILNYFQTENFLIVSVGVVVGVILAIILNLLLMSWFEMPRMPLWYLAVGAAALWILGQLAVLGPALRASHVPPVVATRSV